MNTTAALTSANFFVGAFGAWGSKLFSLGLVAEYGEESAAAGVDQ